MKRIYLMGMKHTGKTRHGRALARTQRRSFLDTDALLQELDATETGLRRTVRDIYLEDGVERFRQLETTACRLASERTDPLVIATGGGICDNVEAFATTEGGVRVHLVDSHESLASRIFARGIPAFLDTRDEQVARSQFRELYDRRVSAYDDLTDLRVDLTGLSPEEAQAKLIVAVEEHLHGGK